MPEELKKSELICYRPAHPNDKNFIVSTWLLGVYHGDTLFSEIDRQIYFEYYHRIVEAILGRPTVIITVAALKEDPDVILGYAVKEGDTLHYIFIKTLWRKIGISTDLLPQNIATFTHATQAGLSFMKHKFPKAKFNPFLS